MKFFKEEQGVLLIETLAVLPVMLSLSFFLTCPEQLCHVQGRAEAAAQVSCVSLADTLAADREGEIFLVPVNGVLEGMMEGSFLDGLLQPEEEAVPSGTGTDLAQGSKSILAYLEKAGELLLSNETIARFKNAIVDKISAMLEEVSAAAVAAISG